MQAYHSSRIVSDENRVSGVSYNGAQEIVHEHHGNRATKAKKHGRAKGRERVTTLDTETSRPGASRTPGWVSRQESGVEPAVTSVVAQDRVKHISSTSAADAGEGVVNIQDEGISREGKKDQESEFKGKTRVGGEAAGRSRRTNSTKRRASKRESEILSSSVGGGGMRTESSKQRHSHKRTSSKEQGNTHEQQIQQLYEAPITRHTARQLSVAGATGNVHSITSAEQRAPDIHLEIGRAHV